MTAVGSPAEEFPSLLDARPVLGGADALEHASLLASRGEAEAGALFHAVTNDRIAIALVLEPETGADRAAQMWPLAQLAVGEALASVAPPETEVTHRWTGQILVNGAECGGVAGVMGPSAGEGDAGAAAPDWLAVGATLMLRMPGDPGADPDRTSLTEELGPTDGDALVVRIARHWLRRLHHWEADGFAPLARDWLTRAEDRGKPLLVRREGADMRGRFLGLDDEGGALLASEDSDEGGTLSLPLLSLWQKAEAGDASSTPAAAAEASEDGIKRDVSEEAKA